MAGSLSDVMEVDALKAFTGQATSILTTTPLAHVYVALATSNWGDASNTEVTGSGYARVDSKGSWGAPSSGSPSSVANNAAVAFAAATGSWSSGSAVKSFLIFDAITGGNLIAGGDLTDQTKTFTTGDAPNFPIGSLTITAD